MSLGSRWQVRRYQSNYCHSLFKVTCSDALNKRCEARGPPQRFGHGTGFINYCMLVESKVDSTSMQERAKHRSPAARTGLSCSPYTGRMRSNNAALTSDPMPRHFCPLTAPKVFSFFQRLMSSVSPKGRKALKSHPSSSSSSLGLQGWSSTQLSQGKRYWTPWKGHRANSHAQSHPYSQFRISINPKSMFFYTFRGS